MSDHDVHPQESPTPEAQPRKTGAPSPALLAALLSVPLAVLVFGAYLIMRDAGGSGQMDVLSRVAHVAGETSAAKSTGTDGQPKPDGAAKSQDATLQSVAPPTPWVAVDAKQRLSRIGVGSCLSQAHPQPIWAAVMGLDKRPDVFLMIGDNVYGDVKTPDLSELVAAYQTQVRHPEYSVVRTAIPFLAIWDDHDYGANDAGANFTYKTQSARLFRDYWQIDTGRPPDQGVYYARTFGPEGQRVQMIFLDTRYFRGNLTQKTADFEYWGRYEPSTDRSQTMLGEAQWKWLEEQLKQPAEIRIVVSSVQVLAEGHGFERWGNLPHESERLFELIEQTGARGVVMVSGDRHTGALYEDRIGTAVANTAAAQTIPEMTTSSLNRSYGPSKDGPSNKLMSAIFNQENFGLVDIDWQGRKVTLALKGIAGQDLASRDYSFEALGLSQ